MNHRLESAVQKIQRTPAVVRSWLTGKFLAQICRVESSCEILATDEGLFFYGMNEEFIRISSKDILSDNKIRSFDIKYYKDHLISELNNSTENSWIMSWWALNEIAPKEAYTSLLMREQSFGPFTVSKRYLPNGRGFFNTFSSESLRKLSTVPLANSAAQIDDCNVWLLPSDYMERATETIAKYAIELMA